MTNETEVSEEFLRQLMPGAEMEAQDFHGNKPAGAVISEHELAPGNTMQFTKNKSAGRGQAPVIERVKLYDRLTGDISNVPPPIAMDRYRRDPRRYTTIKPKDWKEPVPIADTCLVCLKNPERRGVPKKFFDEDQLIAHYKHMHPSEWETMERKRDREERSASDKRMEALIATIAGLVARDVKIPEDVQTQISTLQSKATKVCPECGEELPVQGFVYARHMKTHKKET